MSEFQFVKPGLNAVGQYQLSGIPWVSASVMVQGGNVTMVEFPTVTRFVTVINDATGSNKPLRVGFSTLGVSTNGHYFKLDNGESYTGEFRVINLYMAEHGDTLAGATASVVAGLTMIDEDNLPTNWSSSAGSDPTSSIYNEGIG
jgi:hypothetical protein